MAPRACTQGLELTERVENHELPSREKGHRQKSKSSSSKVETRPLGRDKIQKAAAELIEKAPELANVKLDRNKKSLFWSNSPEKRRIYRDKNVPWSAVHETVGKKHDAVDKLECRVVDVAEQTVIIAL